ncbi:hypothetical protein LCGC14_1635480 [marine sediment metagenome]|uniref:Uncharacterized protein n=1 Tax=marine sediment metagenome TaxID=412755 RepID=A0A0F9L0S6_9ZZZZ
MGKSGAVLGLIGIILGAGGLVFGYLNWTSQSNNSTQNKVVGVWDGLDENQDYSGYDQPGVWLFEFTDNEMNDTAYIFVSNANTRITLLKPGWYRIHLSTELNSLDSGLHYYLKLLKDHSIDMYLYHFDTMTSVPPGEFIDSSAFVYSDGTNYIEIGASCSNPTVSFVISSSASMNQFSIEFVSP